LSFQEQNYFDDPPSDGGQHYSPAHATDNSDESDTDAPKSALELYGLGPSSRKGKKRLAQATKQASASSTEESMPKGASSTGEDGNSNGDDAGESKSAKKKKRNKKKRKLAESVIDAVEKADTANVETTAPQKPVTISNVLAKFIGTKRNLQDIPEPPEIEPPQDTFLKLFQDTFVLPPAVGVAAEPSGVETADDESSSDSSDESSYRQKGDLQRNASAVSLATSTGGDSVQFTSGDTFALQFFNLPYKITEGQVRARCSFSARSGRL
jgi:hypothetical protein